MISPEDFTIVFIFGFRLMLTEFVDVFPYFNSLGTIEIIEGRLTIAIPEIGDGNAGWSGTKVER